MVMEEWDIYDCERNRTGKVAIRGNELLPGEYHLVVFAIIRNTDGKYIISKRSVEKTFANTWEVTGGSAVVGDTSIEAVKREVEEELGIELIGDGNLIKTYKTDSECSNFSDVWYFEQDVALEDIICQVGEVSDARIVNMEEIDELFEQGLFMPGNPHIYKCMKERHLSHC
jgi:mutator protein MutT